MNSVGDVPVAQGDFPSAQIDITGDGGLVKEIRTAASEENTEQWVINVT